MLLWGHSATRGTESTNSKREPNLSFLPTELALNGFDSPEVWAHSSLLSIQTVDFCQRSDQSGFCFVS